MSPIAAFALLFVICFVAGAIGGVVAAMGLAGYLNNLLEKRTHAATPPKNYTKQ